METSALVVKTMFDVLCILQYYTSYIMETSALVIKTMFYVLCILQYYTCIGLLTIQYHSFLPAHNAILCMLYMLILRFYACYVCSLYNMRVTHAHDTILCTFYMLTFTILFMLCMLAVQ